MKFIQKKFLNESGQMVIFAVIGLMLVLLILFVVISNLTVDIKETQVEREYEIGYAIAEAEIFEIGNSSFAKWKTDTGASRIRAGTQVQGVDVSKYCDTGFTCFYICSLGDEGEGCVIVKKKTDPSAAGIGPSIEKDKVLEVDVAASSGTIDLAWASSPAMSVMLLCQNQTTKEITSYRGSYCRSGSGTCGTSFIEGFDNLTAGKALGGPLNLSTCGAGSSPLLLRLRNVSDGAAATNIQFNNPTVSIDVEEIHVQGFPAGFANAEQNPAPELYYVTTGVKDQLPAIFDYVLFVANGGVVK